MSKEFDREAILKTEYNEEFDELRKNRMIMSFYKYGPLRENYENKLVDSPITNLLKRLELYNKTGNKEHLCDVANFAMIEFMYPYHKNAHFDNMTQSPGIGKCTYRDIENMKRGI